MRTIPYPMYRREEITVVLYGLSFYTGGYGRYGRYGRPHIGYYSVSVRS
jgi:hypothetical protein